MTDKNGATWRSADELLAQALRYRTYWKNGGGITVSGGEPLLQIDFLLDLFKKQRQKVFTQRLIPQAVLLPEKNHFSQIPGADAVYRSSSC